MEMPDLGWEPVQRRRKGKLRTPARAKRDRGGVSPYGDTEMKDANTSEDKSNVKSRIEQLEEEGLLEEPTKQVTIGREVFKRHVSEKKEVKKHIKDLKTQRRKLTNRNCRDQKKAISKEIKKALKDLQTRHSDELKALGLGSGVKYTDDVDMDDA